MHPYFTETNNNWSLTCNTIAISHTRVAALSQSSVSFFVVLFLSDQHASAPVVLRGACNREEIGRGLGVSQVERIAAHKKGIWISSRRPRAAIGRRHRAACMCARLYIIMEKHTTIMMITASYLRRGIVLRRQRSAAADLAEEMPNRFFHCRDCFPLSSREIDFCSFVSWWQLTPEMQIDQIIAHGSLAI